MRVGLFGGTFDPIHKGHIELAELALQKVKLDQIIFIPSGLPPHKNAPEATFAQRADMVALAIEDEERFALSILEGESETYSYTIDTLDYFSRKFQEGTELFFLLGIDTFLDITSWKHYKEILSIVNFIITERHGYDSTVFSGFANALHYRKIGNDKWCNSSGKQIITIAHSPCKISSSQIRGMACDANLMTGFLPKSVVDYISDKKIYGCD